MKTVDDVADVWFTEELARWLPTYTSGVDDVTRWAWDDEHRIWLTTVSTHSTAQPDSDPAERRVYPALLLENAVRTVRDATGHDPFGWDIGEVVSNPGPPDDSYPCSAAAEQSSMAGCTWPPRSRSTAACSPPRSSTGGGSALCNRAVATTPS